MYAETGLSSTKGYILTWAGERLVGLSWTVQSPSIYIDSRGPSSGVLPIYTIHSFTTCLVAKEDDRGLPAKVLS